MFSFFQVEGMNNFEDLVVPTKRNLSPLNRGASPSDNTTSMPIKQENFLKDENVICGLFFRENLPQVFTALVLHFLGELLKRGERNLTINYER